QYVYVNAVPIRDGKDSLLVNWCELNTTDSSGKTIYRNAFITDFKIHEKNVVAIVEDGRARWKTENENNNTLKRQGYNLEHNFGVRHEVAYKGLSSLERRRPFLPRNDSRILNKVRI